MSRQKQQQIWTKLKPFYDSVTWARLLQEREKEIRRAGITAPQCQPTCHQPMPQHIPWPWPVEAPAGLAGSGQVCLGHRQWGPREPAAPGLCLHCWTRKSLLSPPRICWVNPDISQPSPLLSPAVPVWRRAAGDPLRPYIFQKEPLGCQQEDSTLIVTQESLISWDKTLIAASSPRGCRWHGFHHHHHPPARLRHLGNLLPILDEQMSDWRSSWECFFSPPPAPLAF